MARTNVILGVLLILFASWYLWLAAAAPRRRFPYDPGIMFFPQVFAVALILLSLLLVLRQVVKRLPRPDEAPPDRLDSREWVKTAGLLGLTIAYPLLLPWLGFLLATPVYLIGAMLLSGSGRRLSTGVIAVVVTGVIYVSFVYFFKVLLP